MTYHYSAQYDGYRHYTRKCRKSSKVARRELGYAAYFHFASKALVKPIRKHGNRKLRRYKGDVSDHGWYKRFYDVSWTAF